ncbi:uncharacterized protein Z519_12393 [Cladophialophora bantiana CBS 173.52]|uniref:Uncharacterized protein n=1 Tax=Cladophialophora bantiana (strain ATCC 10958 / CBS 173.52 / CDC B-1940 / NIH 8579) TaxID=1442370 RepID=A0A0D2H0Y4_CLAB1|nr:uncharacterized protein Z519_12393 [Cladophialophora bantiana CBS 173.52]KIW86928.1 hypothetical protein Z519_12393 [Cladophialophora bantiana CBS 173.52]
MAHICLEQFRIDTLRSVEREIKPEHVEEALRNPQPFYYQYFRQIMLDRRIHTVTGNKSDFKEPLSLVEYLFNWDDQFMNHRYRAGWPADLPEWISWSPEQWAEWIATQQRRIDQARDSLEESPV